MKEKRKHAYCIIAHNEPQLLNNLVDLIDDERNDIFLLIDMKSDMSMFSGITTNYAHLYMSPRVDIRWGDSSQIIAELTLFEFALAHGPYQIYHLISGVDLPIKPQDYIHHFVNSHPNIEFVGFKSGQELEKIIRMSRFTIIPSIWYDNLPNTALESFKYSKPVIASDLGSLPELVTDGVNGYLFNPYNADELVQCILKLDDDNNVIKMGEAGRRLMDGKFSAENHYNNLMEVMNKCL